MSSETMQKSNIMRQTKNKMKKVYVIKGKDADELAKNINEFDKQIFATQPMQTINGSWCAFVYVNEDSKGLPEPIKEDLATDNQLYFLKNREIATPEGLTKSQAFDLIKEIKGSEK